MTLLAKLKTRSAGTAAFAGVAALATLATANYLVARNTERRQLPRGYQHQVGPPPKLVQVLELTLEIVSEVGSRSAPIGTPPRTKFPEEDQGVESGQGGGPTSVLIYSCPPGVVPKARPSSA